VQLSHVKSKDHKPRSRQKASHEYDETAFKRSWFALSLKTPIQSLCLRAISWAGKQICKDLVNGSGRKAVDIGCAYGYVTELLSQLHYDAVGLDISKYALGSGEKIGRIQGDAQTLPLRSDSIDVISCFDTLEHLSAPRLLLKESRRCLHSEGVLIIENPIANPIDIVSDRLHKMDEIHPSLLTFQEITSIVEKSGFRVIGKGLLPIPFQRFPLFGRYIEIGVSVSIARRILVAAL
jgi:SAM-dependent methyltransferase